MDFLTAIKERHSVRVYKDVKIEEDIRQVRDTFVEKVNEESGLHIMVRYDDPDWFAAGVEAALLAPTAVNQQKFKIGMIEGKPAIRISGKGIHTDVDLGIVKYHFEVVSGHKVV